MKIICRHGHFLFDETEPGEIGRFSMVYDVELEALGDLFTFPFLVDAEKFSLVGKTYLNLPATKMFEGEPWEIMKANGLVYDLGLDLLKPVLTVVSVVELMESDFYYVSKSLIQPGSLLKSGDRIVDYTAWFDWKSSSFKYTEIGFL